MDKVVCNVSVLVCGAPPNNWTFGGLSVQVEFAGALVQFTAIVAANLACGVSVIVEVPADPCVTVSVFGEAEMLKSGPEPVKVTV